MKGVGCGPGGGLCSTTLCESDRDVYGIDTYVWGAVSLNKRKYEGKAVEGLKFY